MDNLKNSQVKIGNGALLNAKSKGTVKIQTKEEINCIREVLLVPDLEQNVLSMVQLVGHGYSVHLESGGRTIYDKGMNGKTIRSEMKK